MVDEPHYEYYCDGCGALLKSACSGKYRLKTPTLQLEGALVLRFSGGYGMYFDPIGEEPEPVLLCKQCADALFAQFPFLKTAITGGNQP